MKEERHRGFRRELHHRVVGCQIDLQFLRHFEYVEAVDHFRRAGFLAVADAVLHQLQKPVPAFIAMHAAHHAFAVAEAVFKDHRADAVVDGGGIHCDGGAEAGAAERDACGIDLRPRRHVGDGVLRVGDFFHRDHAARFSAAVAATPIVEAQCDIAPGFELFADPFGAAVLVGAEAVHHDDRRAAFSVFAPVRHMDDPRQRQAVGRECDGFLHEFRPCLLHGSRLHIRVGAVERRSCDGRVIVRVSAGFTVSGGDSNNWFFNSLILNKNCSWHGYCLISGQGPIPGKNPG